MLTARAPSPPIFLTLVNGYWVAVLVSHSIDTIYPPKDQSPFRAHSNRRSAAPMNTIEATLVPKSAAHSLKQLRRCGFALVYATVFLSAVLLAQQQQQSFLPELPADVSKDAVIRMLLLDKTPTGQDAVWTSPDGTIHEF